MGGDKGHHGSDCFAAQFLGPHLSPLPLPLPFARTVFLRRAGVGVAARTADAELEFGGAERPFGQRLATAAAELVWAGLQAVAY